MTKESLIAAGLTEEQAVKVLSLHQASINGAYVPKATFDAEREKSKSLATQVAERDTQLTELGKFKGTAEQLQAKVSTLEQQNTEAKAAFEAELVKAQKDSAIKLEIMSKVVDVDDVIPKLDFTKINFKDGKIDSGLSEQLEALKKSKPHYFTPDEKSATVPKGWIFGNTPPEGADGDGKKQDPAALFGAELAKSRVSGESVAAKVAEHYFK